MVFIKYKAAKSREGVKKWRDGEPETNAGRRFGGCWNEREVSWPRKATYGKAKWRSIPRTEFVYQSEGRKYLFVASHKCVHVVINLCQYIFPVRRRTGSVELRIRLLLVWWLCWEVLIHTEPTPLPDVDMEEDGKDFMPLPQTFNLGTASSLRAQRREVAAWERTEMAIQSTWFWLGFGWIRCLNKPNR